MKKIILFDIDHTLINTERLRKYTKKGLIEITGLPSRVFKTLEQKYIDCLSNPNMFKPDGYVKFVSDFTGVKYRRLFEASYGRIDIYKKSLFPNTIKGLKFLSERYSLGIFSEGIENYQLFKLRKSSIIHYFDTSYIYISKNKLAHKIIKKLPRKVIIVDNNKEILRALLKKIDFVPIWFNRNNIVDSNMKTIVSLKQIEKVLEL